MQKKHLTKSHTVSWCKKIQKTRKIGVQGLLNEIKKIEKKRKLEEYLESLICLYQMSENPSFLIILMWEIRAVNHPKWCETPC